VTPADERLLRLLDARDTPRWLVGRLFDVSPERAEQLLEQVRSTTPPRGRVRRSVMLAQARRPDVLVLAVPPDASERDAMRIVRDAAVPGWTFRVDASPDALADAIATARHRAAERGDDFEVHDRARAVVHVRDRETGEPRAFRLFVVRRSEP
jgi:MoxR-like ATPase